MLGRPYVNGNVFEKMTNQIMVKISMVCVTDRSQTDKQKQLL